MKAVPWKSTTRASRRTLLRGAAVAGTGAFAALMVGCGDDGKPATATSSIRAGSPSPAVTSPAPTQTATSTPTATSTNVATASGTTPTAASSPPDGKSVVYRQVGGSMLKLDLFLPGPGSHPAVLFFPGRTNPTSQFWPQARAFAAAGYVAACVQYRTAAPFPAPVTDGKAAVRWLRAHAGEYGIDPKRIVAAGGSLGGHVAALEGSAPSLWEEGDNLDQTSGVKAVMLFNPALTWSDVGPGFEAFAPGFRKLYLGGTPDEAPAAYAAASAFTYASGRVPPTLVLQGTDDQIVPYKEAAAYVDALKTAGGLAELYTADGVGHGFFNTEPWYTRTLDIIQAFAAKHG